MAGATLRGKRVFITGAARGIGAALAQRLHAQGARVAIAGLEPELLASVAASVDGPHWYLDVTDRAAVASTIDAAAAEFGGLDIVVANAGIAAQTPIADGDPVLFERIVQVNLLGSYNTLRAAAKHVSHADGYALAVSSMGAAVNLPLMGAYSASKAGVEAMGNTLRIEMRPSGAKVGVAYFAELDTDMTTRGFDTDAAKKLLKGRSATRVTPLKAGIDALEKGISKRSRIIVAPGWARPGLSLRMFIQRPAELIVRRNMGAALEAARGETVELTTPQPD